MKLPALTWSGLRGAWEWTVRQARRVAIPAGPLTIILAALVGLLGGYGAVLFTALIGFVTEWTVVPAQRVSVEHRLWLVGLCLVPAAGLVAVAWFTRRYAPEAQGHGVPEVITAIARQDGVIRPRVSVVKILASGLCIGTGGSIGREGPIVQIGSSLGSMAGQLFKLSARNIKLLVASGAAAGISATFNAPLAGVMFASEIIIGSFAVESLAPIVIASVLADVVRTEVGQQGYNPAFVQLHYEFRGAWEQLPAYVLLGLLCGVVAVSFTKLLYLIEDLGERRLRAAWARALTFGALVGLLGVVYPNVAPSLSPAARYEMATSRRPLPPLFGVGYGVVDHALHLELVTKPSGYKGEEVGTEQDRTVRLDKRDMLAELWWLLPLALLKPLATSLTLGGGGSGGIFAPSLVTGASLGAAFGIVCNLLFPSASANPGVYAIVGMGAVVAGTTHGTLSAILIVYEMTGDYRIILPIMVAAGLSSIVARVVDPDSIYLKKLTRRGESVARGYQMHGLEHIMVRDVMVRHFPKVRHTDNMSEIIRVARANPDIEGLPVMGDDGQLVGIIRAEDLRRILDSDVPPHLVSAQDLALALPIAVAPDANLIEALCDFASRDVETLPVESRVGNSRRVVGLLRRSDVMRAYRREMLRPR